MRVAWWVARWVDDCSDGWLLLRLVMGGLKTVLDHLHGGALKAHSDSGYRDSLEPSAQSGPPPANDLSSALYGHLLTP